MREGGGGWGGCAYEGGQKRAEPLPSPQCYAKSQKCREKPSKQVIYKRKVNDQKASRKSWTRWLLGRGEWGTAASK